MTGRSGARDRQPAAHARLGAAEPAEVAERSQLRGRPPNAHGQRTSQRQGKARARGPGGVAQRGPHRPCLAPSGYAASSRRKWRFTPCEKSVVHSGTPWGRRRWALSPAPTSTHVLPSVFDERESSSLPPSHFKHEILLFKSSWRKSGGGLMHPSLLLKACFPPVPRGPRLARQGLGRWEGEESRVGHTSTLEAPGVPPGRHAGRLPASF